LILVVLWGQPSSLLPRIRSRGEGAADPRSWSDSNSVVVPTYGQFVCNGAPMGRCAMSRPPTRPGPKRSHHLL